jgi:SMODS-associated and fused to various effectors sensor domain
MVYSKSKKKKTVKSTKIGVAAGQALKLKVTDPQVLELWVRAGGRCEVHGCNEYLLQDKLTTMMAKLADIAHIVARSIDGPRGNDLMPLKQRNNFKNLFLACTKHHRMIDNKALVGKYPKELLVQYKRTHEETIRFVTGLGDEHETVVIRLLGNIRGNTISISNEEIREAVLKSSNRYPRYLGGEHHIEIDLTTVPDGDVAQYWGEGVRRIKDVIDRRVTPAIEKNEIRHCSFFAFARIPFLAYLGHAIGDKTPLEIFQKHRRGSEGWVWATSGKEQKFAFRKEREGLDKARVAVMLSLSGQILVEHLPSLISTDFTIYSLVPEGCAPSRNLLSSKGSLEQFRHTYASLLREIEANYPLARVIHVFPAVPISAAIVLGRELLRNVSPSLIVYDKGIHEFEQAIKIDSDEKG